MYWRDQFFCFLWVEWKKEELMVKLKVEDVGFGVCRRRWMFGYSGDGGLLSCWLLLFDKNEKVVLVRLVLRFCVWWLQGFGFSEEKDEWSVWWEMIMGIEKVLHLPFFSHVRERHWDPCCPFFLFKPWHIDLLSLVYC